MQNAIYNAGLNGILPDYPVDFATLQERAQSAIAPSLLNHTGEQSDDHDLCEIGSLRRRREQRAKLLRRPRDIAMLVLADSEAPTMPFEGVLPLAVLPALCPAP